VRGISLQTYIQMTSLPGLGRHRGLCLLAGGLSKTDPSSHVEVVKLSLDIKSNSSCFALVPCVLSGQHGVTFPPLSLHRWQVGKNALPRSAVARSLEEPWGRQDGEVMDHW